METERLLGPFTVPQRKKEWPHVDPDIEAIRLRDSCAVYCKHYEFKVGDLICFKKGIQILSQVRSDIVYVVMDCFPDAEMCLDYSSNLYGVRFDLHVGFYDEDEDFVFAAMDSRRMEPWSRPE